MRRHSPIERFSCEDSSGDGDYTGSDAGDRLESDTDLTDVDAVADEDDEDDEDEAWLSPSEDHPPEHYLQELEMFDEEEYTKQDYKDSSTRLINRMEDEWNQYVSHPHVACARMHGVTLA
jgi:hypothetical protein